MAYVEKLNSRFQLSHFALSILFVATVARAQPSPDLSVKRYPWDTGDKLNGWNDKRSTLSPLYVLANAAQENFFKYARENFSLDRIIDYRTQQISEPIRVVNPAYCKLDGEVR